MDPTRDSPSRDFNFFKEDLEFSRVRSGANKGPQEAKQF